MQYICVCDELAGDVPRPCLLGLLTLSRAAADTDTAGDIVLADTPLLLRWAFGYPPCGFLRGGAEVEVEPGSFLQLTAGETAQTAQTVTTTAVDGWRHGRTSLCTPEDDDTGRGHARGTRTDEARFFDYCSSCY